jgi:predicted choloylglycine hydrolase
MKIIPDEITFTHIVLEGTPYQVGRQQAEALKVSGARAGFLTPTLPFLDAFTPREAQRALDYIERICPGLRDEIQGAADGYGVPLEEIAFLGGKSKEDGSSPIPVGGEGAGVNQPGGGGGCSQFIVLRSLTDDGHLYAAQNTDCGPDDLDLRLCTTRVQGKPAHIGFSDMIFGRTGGINEHGLCVNTTWGAPMMWPPGEGVPYFIVVRALLDRCRTVSQALDALAAIPVAWCTNITLCDPAGEAALVEVAGSVRAVVRGGNGPAPPFLAATNHFTSPELNAYRTDVRCESLVRKDTITSCLGNGARISKDEIRALLSEPFPGGVCLHHYRDGLGTLWSTITDVSASAVEVCFGAPSSEANSWRRFGLDDAVGVTHYTAHLPDSPSQPGFWERASLLT